MTSVKNSFQRLYWIDRIKGVAILGIIVFHFFQIYPQSVPIIKTLDTHLPKVGFAMVDIFFLISGFNASYALKKYDPSIQKAKNFWVTWLKKRLTKIYATYWLAIIYICLLTYIFNGTIKLNSLTDFFLIAIGFPSYDLFKLINPGFWFVSVIVQAYLLIPLLLSFTLKNPKKLLILGIVVSIINKLICFLLLLLYGNRSQAYYFFLQTNFIGSYFFPLCLGLYWGIIFKRDGRFRRKDWWLSLIAFSLGIVWQLIILVNQSNVRYKLGLDLLVVPLLTLILYATFKTKNNSLFVKYIKQFMSYLGRNSYPIFLIHQPIFFLFLVFWQKTLGVDPYITIILTAIAVSINLALLLKLFIVIDFYWTKLIKNYL